MYLPKCLLVSIIASAVALPALAQGQMYQDPQGQTYQQSGGYPMNNGGMPPNYAPQGYPQQQGYMPTGGPMQPPPPMQIPARAPANVPAAKGKAGAMSVAQWFNSYDQIRHQAQMSPAEKQRSDSLLSRGLSILIPGDEKIATKGLLTSMVVRYRRACDQLKSLPQLNQTSQLHHAYYNYFMTAGQLFTDYVRVQDNLMVTDATTGQPLASSLLQRKQMLEALEHQCKEIDAQTRAQFHIKPYPW